MTFRWLIKSCQRNKKPICILFCRHKMPLHIFLQKLLSSRRASQNCTIIPLLTNCSQDVVLICIKLKRIPPVVQAKCKFVLPHQNQIPQVSLIYYRELLNLRLSDPLIDVLMDFSFLSRVLQERKCQKVALLDLRKQVLSAEEVGLLFHSLIQTIKLLMKSGSSVPSWRQPCPPAKCL